IAGLGQAAQSYGDADWCEALLLAWAVAARRGDRMPLEAATLFAAFNPARAEVVFRSLIEFGPPGLTHLVGVRTDPWSLDFSRFFIDNLPRWLATWHYAMAALLRDAPLRLDPRVLPAAEMLVEAPLDSMWETQALDRLVDTLEYRHAMRQELV